MSKPKKSYSLPVTAVLFVIIIGAGIIFSVIIAGRWDASQALLDYEDSYSDELSALAPEYEEPPDVTSTNEPSSLQSSEPPASSAPAAPADTITSELKNSLSEAFSGDIGSLSTKKRGWGPGKHMDVNNRPIGAILAQTDYGKYNAFFIENENDKVIYLTFDQGYENGYTTPILDTLKEKNVKAVFFLTGDYAKRQSDLVQRMIDEGHVIGNHGMKHLSMPEATPEQCRTEIESLDTYVKEQYGVKMTLFRPPMGEFSEQSLAVTQSLGYKTLFWSFAYKDWEVNNQMGSDKAYGILSKAHHNGAILLLHSVSKDNAAILGDVIDCYREHGYSFGILS